MCNIGSPYDCSYLVCVPDRRGRDVKSVRRKPRVPGVNKYHPNVCFDGTQAADHMDGPFEIDRLILQCPISIKQLKTYKQTRASSTMSRSIPSGLSLFVCLFTFGLGIDPLYELDRDVADLGANNGQRGGEARRPHRRLLCLMPGPRTERTACCDACCLNPTSWFRVVASCLPLAAAATMAGSCGRPR